MRILRVFFIIHQQFCLSQIVTRNPTLYPQLQIIKQTILVIFISCPKNPNYILKLGNSSTDVKSVACVRLDSDVTVKQCQNRMGKPGFKDLVLTAKEPESAEGLDVLVLATDAIKTETVVYKKDEYTDPALKNLPTKTL